MPTPIQKQPSGLLSLLGLIGKGTYPRGLADEVRPVVSIGDFYASADLRTDQTVVTLQQTAGDRADLDVPAGEAWYMLGISGSVASFSAAGDSPIARLSMRPPAGNPTFTLTSNDHVPPTVAATTDVFDLVHFFPQRFIALAGTQFSIVLARTIVATATIRVRALFHRLRG